MLRGNRFRIWLAIALLVGSSGVAAGITLNQVDTFQDGTTDNWTDGFGGTNVANISTGGPDGGGDRFLQLSSGRFGTRPRLITFNQSQWTGDYSAAGVGSVILQLKNFGPIALPIRIAIRDQTGQSAPGYSSTVPFTLPADGGWHQAQFNLTAADMTAVGSPDALPTVLTDVMDFRLLSSAAPSIMGDTIDAQVGVDNFTAVSLSPGVWTGASGTNWADGGNWSGAVPGATTGTTNADTATFNQNAPHSPLTIDAGRNVQNITFDTAGVNSLTVGAVGGQALLLTAGGTIQTTSSVVNAQTVNAPLVLEGAYTFSSGAGSSSTTLTFGSGFAPGATSGVTTLTLGGGNAGANTISGVLADNGAGKLAVTKSGSGLWILAGANTNSGDIAILGGTLKFDLASGTPTIAAGVTATVASGATLELAGTVSALGSTAGNRVHIVNDSTASGVVVSGSDQLVGAIDGLGNTQVNAGSDLTANRIIQNALVIDGFAGSSAKVTIAASDPSGNPLIASLVSLRGDSGSVGLNSANSLTSSGSMEGDGISSAIMNEDAELAVLSSGSSAGGGILSPVPEPSTLVLMLVAASSVIGWGIALRHRAGIGF